MYDRYDEYRELLELSEESKVRKYIYLNATQSVEIEPLSEVEKVFINGAEHLFTDTNGSDVAVTSDEKGAFAQKQKRAMYAGFLNHQFENLVVLTGAGSSAGFGGSLMFDLWDAVEDELTKKTLRIFCGLVKYGDYQKDDTGRESTEFIKNLEKLLTCANAAKEYVVDENLNIAETIKLIEKTIRDKCTFLIPETAPHKLFLEKIAKRKVTSPRAKIFTLNYDTLFEQAGIKSGFTIIDGFSFSFPRIFNGRNFDYDIVQRDNNRVKGEDNFISKVFHLYKLHGSITWERKNDTNEYIQQSERPENPLMIYPKNSKYESSYEQPYFEMMSRFQQNLRKENVLLICIGFSFGDKHIVTAIQDALTQNSSFQLVVVNKEIDENGWLFDLAKKHSNVVLISELFSDFALHYPDLKTYNQEIHKPIVINHNGNSHE